MRKYTKTELSEHSLEDKIRLYPELIEDGLKYIDHQKRVDRGPLDVLMVDSGNALVVAELKVAEDDGMLAQGLDYYDSCVQNLEGIARAYSKHNIDTKQDPRLMLVAPSFSINLMNRCKWLNIPISLFEFQCIKCEDDEDVTPIFKEARIPTLPKKIGKYELKDRFEYITNDEMRNLAMETIDEIKKWESKRIHVEPTMWDISIKVSGIVFAYICPRRSFFHIQTHNQDGKWSTYPIYNKDDLKGPLELVKLNFEKKK